MLNGGETVAHNRLAHRIPGDRAAKAPIGYGSIPPFSIGCVHFR